MWLAGGCRFNLRKLSEMEVRKQYQIKTSNRCAALQNLNDIKDINRALENCKDNNKTSAKERLRLYEPKQYKPSLMKNIHIFFIKGSRPQCSGNVIQTKAM
jgi:hypothetical protein